MKNSLIIIILLFLPSLTFAGQQNHEIDPQFYIGKMESYDNKFTLYFKTRPKAVVAKGESQNYMIYYPQDLFLYDHSTKKDYPLISYDWFPKKVEQISRNYDFPLFPEDFAYYLLDDNDTIILISATKNFFQNLQYNIKENKLTELQDSGKLKFIISSYAKSCGFKSLTDNYKCKYYRPLISKTLLSSIE